MEDRYRAQVMQLASRRLTGRSSRFPVIATAIRNRWAELLVTSPKCTIFED